MKNDKILINTKPREFWKFVLYGLIKYIVAIIVITVFISAIKDNVSFKDMLPYTLSLILIPIFQIIFQRRDEIYYLSILKDNEVKVKWKKWHMDNVLILPLTKVSAVIKPSLKSCFLLKIQFEDKSAEINQLCSKVWNQETMEVVAEALNSP